MGPWPTEYRTCQNLCNINKAKYLFLSLQKVLHIGGQVTESFNSRVMGSPGKLSVLREADVNLIYF